jgi:hypothetical protein
MVIGAYFKLMQTPAPYIFIMSVTGAADGRRNLVTYAIAPGEMMWGISFDDMARAGSGRLVRMGRGRGLIVGNDDFPPGAANPR